MIFVQLYLHIAQNFCFNQTRFQYVNYTIRLVFLDEWLSHERKLDKMRMLVFDKILWKSLFTPAAPHKCIIDNITSSHRCGDFAIVLCCNLQLITVWRLFLSVPSTAGQLPIWSQTYWENTAKWQEIPLWTTPQQQQLHRRCFQNQAMSLLHKGTETSTKGVYFSWGQEKESMLRLK